jgi:tRNA A58 N-methylase Trm61
MPLSINTLSTFSSSRDTVHQALALIFNLLTEDNRTKVNLSSVRQMALTAGIIDIVQLIEKKYGKESPSVQGLCQSILNSLISEWS